MGKPKFNKGYNEVLDQGYFFHNQFLIDQADFIAASPKYAIPFAANFLTDLQAADAIPTHEDDVAHQLVLTSQVEAKMEECRVHFQKLMMYVRLAFPDDQNAQYEFEISTYEKARSSVLKMINLMQHAHATADSVTYKATLIAAGFLQLDIDKLGTLKTELDDANEAQSQYIRQTVRRTNDRIDAFNKFWDTMSMISDTAKTIYANDEAQIQMYLLYPDNPIPLPPGVPQNLAYASASHLFSWDPVLTATSYQLVYREVGNIGWTTVYEGTDAFVEFSPLQGDWEFSVRARNAGGYGDYAVPINVNVPLPLQPPSNVSVTWNPLSAQRTSIIFTPHSGTTSIDVYQSMVAVGAPAGTYSLLGNFPAVSPIRQGGIANQRIYVYLIAKNATEESEPSAVAFCDNV